MADSYNTSKTRHGDWAVGAHRNLVYVEVTGQPPGKATFEERQLMKTPNADILCTLTVVQMLVHCAFPRVVPVTWMKEWGH